MKIEHNTFLYNLFIKSFSFNLRNLYVTIYRNNGLTMALDIIICKIQHYDKIVDLFVLFNMNKHELQYA